jgi:acetyltransferase-like isoleucine patch superfamily enzyme
MKKILNKIRNFLNFHIRHPWVKYGKNVHCQWTASIWCPNKIMILGNNVGIGPFTTIQTDIIIGNNVMLASYVALLGKDAHTTNHIGLPMFSSPRGDQHNITIEDDVWIGFGSIILSGVTIGRGAIVAAGSIITKDVSPYSIVASPAAKKIAERFSTEEIIEHEKRMYKT